MDSKLDNIPSYLGLNILSNKWLVFWIIATGRLTMIFTIYVEIPPIAFWQSSVCISCPSLHIAMLTARLYILFCTMCWIFTCP